MAVYLRTTPALKCPTKTARICSWPFKYRGQNAGTRTEQNVFFNGCQYLWKRPTIHKRKRYKAKAAEVVSDIKGLIC